jgi:hypothetical protein
VREDTAIALKRFGLKVAKYVRPVLDGDDRFARNKATEVLTAVGYVSQQVSALGKQGKQKKAKKNLLAIGRAEGLAVLQASLVAAPDKRTESRLKKILGKLPSERTQQEETEAKR